jgi:hypothetical protein
VSGKRENIRLYWAFCSASEVRRLEMSDSCSGECRSVELCYGKEGISAWVLPSSSSSSREASESSDSDGYLNVLRSLVAAITTNFEVVWDTQVHT